MSNAVYPTLSGLAFDSIRSPQFKTIMQESASGRESRMGLRLYPKYEYELVYEFLKSDVSAEFQTLFGFFLQRRGSFDSFLFIDPDDNSVTDQNIGTGDGSTTDFQLARSFGGFAEPVMNPNVITNVKVAGSNASYTNQGLGVVRITPAPASSAAVTWTGTYYVRARFVEDIMEFNKFMAKFWEARSVAFLGSLGNKV